MHDSLRREGIIISCPSCCPHTFQGVHLLEPDISKQLRLYCQVNSLTDPAQGQDLYRAWKTKQHATNSQQLTQVNAKYRAMRVQPIRAPQGLCELFQGGPTMINSQILRCRGRGSASPVRHRSGGQKSLNTRCKYEFPNIRRP